LKPRIKRRCIVCRKLETEFGEWVDLLNLPYARARDLHRLNDILVSAYASSNEYHLA
jgi:hypothetical protein